MQTEVPSNYLLNKFKKPSLYMGGIVCTWGVVMTLAGITRNFAGLLCVRFALGVAGTYPFERT